MRIHLLEAVNSKKQLQNNVVIVYSVPAEPEIKGVEQSRELKFLRINNSYLFSNWAKRNVRRSENDVEEELLGYIARDELTMIGLEEHKEHLGYQAAFNSLYKSFVNLFTDKRVLMFGAFAATVAFTNFVLPKATVTLPVTLFINPSVGRGG